MLTILQSVSISNKWPQLKGYLDLISGLQSLPFAEQMQYSLIWVKHHTFFFLTLSFCSAPTLV